MSATIEKLAPLGDRHIGERCSDPHHTNNMIALRRCDSCGDIRYPTPADFDDRPRLHIDAALPVTEARLVAGIEAYQRHRHEGPAAIVTAVYEAMVRA